MTISPMTPPGTEVICINDDLHPFRLPNRWYYNTLNGLTKNEIYTVREIRPTKPHEKSRFEVWINEIERPHGGGYAIERFRYLDLARLDELLEVKVERKENEKV